MCEGFMCEGAGIEGFWVKGLCGGFAFNKLQHCEYAHQVDQGIGQGKIEKVRALKQKGNHG